MCNTEGVNTEMPKYRCHKEVWALKIKKVLFTEKGILKEWKYVTIIPEDDGYSPFKVSKEYADKHKPKPGGYYVKYEDGYESYSPAEAFEGGYTLADHSPFPPFPKPEIFASEEIDRLYRLECLKLAYREGGIAEAKKMFDFIVTGVVKG